MVPGFPRGNLQPKTSQLGTWLGCLAWLKANDASSSQKRGATPRSAVFLGGSWGGVSSSYLVIISHQTVDQKKFGEPMMQIIDFYIFTSTFQSGCQLNPHGMVNWHPLGIFRHLSRGHQKNGRGVVFFNSQIALWCQMRSDMCENQNIAAVASCAIYTLED